MARIFWLLALACCCAGSARAASTAQEQALALYDQPTAPAGDELLRRLKANPTRWAPALEQFLNDPKAPPRLRADAARAFAYSAPSEQAIRAAASALGSKDVYGALDPSEWLYLCQKVAPIGGALPCARRLLDEASFLIPMLGGDDGIGKDYALVFILSQAPEVSWNREMGDRLWRGSDSPGSQTALLTALFYVVSLRNDAILARYADDPTRPAPSRARAQSLLAQMSAMERNATPARVAALEKAMGLANQASEEDLRLARSKAMAQVSRRALLDLERHTFLIRAAALARWNEDAAAR